MKVKNNDEVNLKISIDNDKLGLLEKVLKLIGKYGVYKVIGGIFVLGLFAITMGLMVNQKEIMNSLIENKYKEESNKHNATMQVRVKKINPNVNEILLKLMLESGGDRAFVMEMHNGTNNSSGLPFVYSDMTYEQTTNDVTYISDEFERLNLSKYDMPLYLIQNKIWDGSIDDMKGVDRKLYQKFDMVGDKYIYLVDITGNELEIGTLGLTYSKTNHKGDKRVRGLLINASQKLSILLDLRNNSEG